MLDTMEPDAQDAVDLRAVQHCPQCGRPYIQLPVLQCAECGRLRALRAYCFEGGPGLYIAECIDLDILGQGDTPEAAIGALQEAVVDYLRVAFSGDSTGLVLRPSPWPNRLRYHFRRGMARVAERLSGRHGKHYVPSRVPREVEGMALRIARC